MRAAGPGAAAVPFGESMFLSGAEQPLFPAEVEGLGVAAEHESG